MQFILIGLAVMWAIGLLLVAVSFVVAGLDNEWHRIIATLLLTPVWVVVGLAPVALVQQATGPELATLLKAEWECESEHSETAYVMSGKVMIPVTSQVCDVYKRRK